MSALLIIGILVVCLAISLPLGSFLTRQRKNDNPFGGIIVWTVYVIGAFIILSGTALMAAHFIQS